MPPASDPRTAGQTALTETYSGTAWDGSGVLGALEHAAATLRFHVDEVNALNVFPVPDGDTGSNMLATVQAAVTEAAALPADDRAVGPIWSAVSLGALMGARGNSGVILSQLLRGMSDALRDTEQVSGAELAAALRSGRDAALAAVARPVEGTILTVARDAAAAATSAAAGGGDLLTVLSASAEEARASVSRTPSLLAVLRHAGVVDAGGRGLELFLLGMLAYLREEAVPMGPEVADPHPPALEELAAEEYGYETVYLVTPPSGQSLDVLGIRTRLEEMGESVLVAGDERVLKIHIHNERPDEVIAYGLSLGSLSRIVVENLDRQAQDVRQSHGAHQAHDMRPADHPPDHLAASAPRTGPAVVAVAPGAGLTRVFQAIGASAVVQGERAGNPSAGELAQAIRGTGGEQVIVLPNNPNGRLAAEQAGNLCPDVEVAVVPTRNAAEGIAALLALDGSAGLEQNAGQLLRAAHATQTLQVAVAVRDARIRGRRIKKGQHLVLSAEEGLLAAHVDRTEAILDALRGLAGTIELITLYYGQGVERSEAGALSEILSREFDSTEVEVVDGGQPHYSFLIAAE